MNQLQIMLNVFRDKQKANETDQEIKTDKIIEQLSGNQKRLDRLRQDSAIIERQYTSISTENA